MFQLWMGLILIGLIGVDQLTKLWAASALAEKGIVLIPGVLELTLTKNTGAAFSMLEGQRWILLAFSALVSALMLALLFTGRFRRAPLANAGCLLIAAGGIGNFIDRAVTGEVTDFISFRLINFPVFNFADICVVVGAVAIAVYLLFFYEESADKKKNQTEEQDHVDLSAGAGGDED